MKNLKVQLEIECPISEIDSTIIEILKMDRYDCEEMMDSNK